MKVSVFRLSAAAGITAAFWRSDPRRHCGLAARSSGSPKWDFAEIREPARDHFDVLQP